MSLSITLSPSGWTDTRPFWAAVRAEMQATWWGRFRWLWLLSAIAVEVWMAQESRLQLGDWPFQLLCAFAAWIPAWLCADLLAVRYPGNPDPLREWRPSEFLARAAGRLAPFYLVLLLWVGTYTGRSLVQEAANPGNSFPDTGGMAADWTAWTVVFLASALPYAAAAALLSATARRPRRWLVTPVVVVLGSLVLDNTLVALLNLVDTSDLLAPWRYAWDTSPDELLQWCLWPNYWIGFHSAWLWGKLPEWAWSGLRGGSSLAAFCWSASIAFLAYATVPALATWWIAARRYRQTGR
jgi:hypothetical protein